MKALLVLIAALALIVYGLGNALFPLLVSAFIAYLFYPLVKRLEARGVSNEVAAACMLAVALALTATGLVLIVPVLIEDLKALIGALPRIAEAAIHKADDVAGEWGFELEKEELLTWASDAVATLPAGTLKSVGLMFGRTLTGTVGIVLGVVNLLLIPVFFFHLSADFERIVGEIRNLIPPQRRPWFNQLMKRSSEIVSAYCRGQLLVAAFLGTLYGAGFWLMGLKFGLVMGLLMGLLNMIPYAGPVIGLALATVIALANAEGNLIFGVWIIVAIGQSLEGLVITPKIVGDRVGLTALQTMIALIVGGNLFGFVGMLAAVPAAGILKYILLECREHYLRSDFYQETI